MKKNAYLLITLLVIIVGLVAYFTTKPGAKNKYTNNNTAIVNSINPNKTNQVANVNTSNSNINAKTNSSTNSNTNANTNQSNSNASVIPLSHIVSVTDSGFAPSVATIAVNDFVSWQNNSSSTVYVAPDDHPAHVKYVGTWNDTGAGQIASGQQYEFQFKVAGTYSYHNHLNPSQTGTIIVK